MDKEDVILIKTSVIKLTNLLIQYIEKPEHSKASGTHST